MAVPNFVSARPELSLPLGLWKAQLVDLSSQMELSKLHQVLVLSAPLVPKAHRALKAIRATLARQAQLEPLARQVRRVLKALRATKAILEILAQQVLLDHKA
jgi:hypothetical protein